MRRLVLPVALVLIVAGCESGTPDHAGGTAATVTTPEAVPDGTSEQSDTDDDTDADETADELAVEDVAQRDAIQRERFEALAACYEESGFPATARDGGVEVEFDSSQDDAFWGVDEVCRAQVDEALGPDPAAAGQSLEELDAIYDLNLDTIACLEAEGLRHHGTAQPRGVDREQPAGPGGAVRRRIARGVPALAPARGDRSRGSG